MPLAYVCPKRWPPLLRQGFVGLINRCQCTVLSRQCGTRFCGLAIPNLISKVAGKRIASGASTCRGTGSHDDSLSLHGTKSYLLKRLRAAPDTTGGREYGGQSVP